MGKLTDKEFEANQLKNLNYKLKCFLKENIVRNVQGIF